MAYGRLALVLCQTAPVFKLLVGLSAHQHETGHGQLRLLFCLLLNFVAK